MKRQEDSTKSRHTACDACMFRLVRFPFAMLHIETIKRTQLTNIISMVSCQKGPNRHAYAWQIGPFWQDTLDISIILWVIYFFHRTPRPNFDTMLRKLLIFLHCLWTCSVTDRTQALMFQSCRKFYRYTGMTLYNRVSKQCTHGFILPSPAP